MPSHSRFFLALSTATSLALTGCGTSVQGGDGTGGAGGGPGASVGTGGADDGTTSSTAGSGAGAPLDCGAHTRCATDLGDEGRLCEGDGECAFVPGCLTAICIEYEEACAATCRDSDCAILESYPVQIACDGTITDAVDDVTCEEVHAELEAIQSCTSDEECGLVLERTSCGCTRDLVARLDAPEHIFRTLWEAAPDCGFGSSCDCPEADGFACVDGVCSWRYTGGP